MGCVRNTTTSVRMYTELVSRGRNVEEGVEKRKEGRDEGR